MVELSLITELCSVAGVDCTGPRLNATDYTDNVLSAVGIVTSLTDDSYNRPVLGEDRQLWSLSNRPSNLS